jgi:4-amino-4-deoxy-L-arabinose transferase-like glycosyltransferase
MIINKDLFIKNERYIVLFILIIGFLLRFIAANDTKIVTDETTKIQIAQSISFDPARLHLPIVSDKANHPLLTTYLVKIGFILLGKSDLGARILFICLGTVSLLILYQLLREYATKSEAILAMTFMCFSQYFIEWSVLAVEDSLVPFFSLLALYMFLRGIKTESKMLILFTGIVLGVGFLAKETIFFLIPIFFIHILINKEYRYWLKRPALYIALIVAFIIISPSIYWNMQNSLNNNYQIFFDKINATGSRVSFHALYLYLGDVFRLCTFIWEQSSMIGGRILDIPIFGPMWHDVHYWRNEFPVMFLPLGILCLIAVVYSWKDRKSELVCLFLFIFWANILFVSFFARTLEDGTWESYIEGYWWASLSVVPAVALVAHMLEDLRKRLPWILWCELFLVLLLVGNSLLII